MRTPNLHQKWWRFFVVLSSCDHVGALTFIECVDRIFHKKGVKDNANEIFEKNFSFF